MKLRQLVMTAIASAGVATVVASQASGTFAGSNGRIAFTMRTEIGDFDVYTMNPDGTALFQVTTDPARDFNPRWSPDGSRIAFSSNRDGDFDIYVVNADGTGLVRITGTPTDTAGDFVPSWTADGSQIVFQRPFPLESAEIWIANSDGSGGEAKLADGFVPGASSRGRKVAYTGRADNSLHVLNLEDGSDRTITSGAFDAEPNWSPTGNDLVFSRAESSDAFSDIYAGHANGTGLVQLTDTDAPFQSGSAVWSPDGTLIAFTTCDFTGSAQGDCTIETMNRDGTGRTPIAIEGKLFRVGGRIDWQPTR